MNSDELNGDEESTAATGFTQVLDSVCHGGQGPSVLLLGHEADMPSVPSPHTLDEIDDVSGLAANSRERYSLAFVTSQRLAALSKSGSAASTLAALRDRYARVTLVADDDRTLALTDYLALGYERLDVRGVGRAFIFDPDSPSRQREWNNARDWANPENFDKYRW